MDDWTMHVNAVFDDLPSEITYPPSYTAYEFIAEKYCYCDVKTKGKRTITTKVTDFASWGYGPIAFAIKFVTN